MFKNQRASKDSSYADMPKLRIKRFYYRNGYVHLETREVAGKFHGLNRTWHHNGRLAEQLSYRHGLLHGMSPQWDEKGHLLGSFAMSQGTGTQRYWHQNGRLRLEINSLKGKFFGRMRLWLRDGTLVQETYYVNNVDVSRARYLQAAREHPEWPQHEREPAGKVAPDNQTLKRKEHELFIESLLETPCSDARQWLTTGKNANLRSLARFRTARAALEFVDILYAAGAEAVIAAVIYTGKRGKQFADRLLIKLPKTLAKRKALRRICQELCDKRGGAMLPDEKDMGESHLFLNLE
jgi:hypothetical protein